MFRVLNYCKYFVRFFQLGLYFKYYGSGICKKELQVSRWRMKENNCVLVFR